MALQLQLASLMSDPFSSPIYHLVLLLVGQVALFMAWGEWRRTQQAQAQRMMLAMIGLSLLNAGYLAISLVSLAGGSEPVMILPLYERFANTASIGFLAWAFAPSPDHRMKFWDLAIVANLVLALGVLVVSAVVWNEAFASSPTINLNTHWLSAVWKAWQIVLILLSLVGILRNRDEGWIAAVLTMVVLFAGQVMQIAFAESTGGPHMPAWIRLSYLIAYPLMTIAVFQRATTGQRHHSSQLQDINQASLNQIKVLLQLSDASLRVSRSLDLPTILNGAVETVTGAIGADLCAIGLLLEDNPGGLRLAAIHNPKPQDRGKLTTIPLEFQPAIREALREKQYVVLDQSDDAVQVRALYAVLGSSETGSLLIQPLLSEAEAIGAIIVGRTRSPRPFSHHEAKLCEHIAIHLENPIRNARRFQEAQDRIEHLRNARRQEQATLQNSLVRLQQLSQTVTNVEAQSDALREARDSLETQLLSSRAELVSLTSRLAETEADLARQQAEWGGTIHAMLPITTAGVLVTDARAVIRAVNTTAEILLGRSGDELQGLELRALSTAPDWQRAVKMAREGRGAHLEMRIGGNTLTCDVAHLPQPGSDQALEALVVILQSISTEAEAQKAKLETIAAMVEELQTPLSTVVGYADLLLSEAMGGVEGVKRKFLQRMKADAERMRLVVNDLAQEVGTTEPECDPQPQEVQVNDAIESALSTARPQLGVKVLSTDVQLASDLPTIEADPEHVQRILGGLLSNACLASPVGGRIQIRSYRSGGPPNERSQQLAGLGYVAVSIRDQGGGLTDSALDRAFERTRPDQTPPGLGESGAELAIVKALVEANEGHIWIDSRGGIGTTFSFALPVSQPRAESSPRRAAKDPGWTAPEDFVAG